MSDLLHSARLFHLITEKEQHIPLRQSASSLVRYRDCASLTGSVIFLPTINRPSAGAFTNEEFDMRKFVVTLVGTAMLVSALPASASPVQNRTLPQVDQPYQNESYAQYYRRGYRPYYRDRYYYRRDNGAAVAAGVAGLAAGALIAGAIANQAQAQPAAPPPPGTVDPQMAAYCARKYRSYDPGTGTFLATNGMRYVCTYP